MGDGQIFLKSRPDTSFNIVLRTPSPEVGVALMSSATRYSATKRDKENEKRPLFWGATRLLAH